MTILQQRSNNNTIDLRVEDMKGEFWEICNCQMKDPSLMPFISYHGALAVAKGGFNEGHPVHLNQMRKDDWELWMKES